MTTETRNPWHEFVGPDELLKRGGPAGTQLSTASAPPLSTSRRRSLWTVSLGLLVGLLLALGLFLMFVGEARPAFADSVCPSPGQTSTLDGSPSPTPSPCVPVQAVIVSGDTTQLTQVVTWGVGLCVLFSAVAVVSSWGSRGH